jgi:MFS superfamily sulfate permease-like transporter
MFKHIGADLKAGLVVFLVAIPLCLGISLLQGAPLMAGIISGVVGGTIVSIISKSNLSVSGPSAALTGVVVLAISSLGTYEKFLTAVCIAGIIQVIFGLVRAGMVSHYIPSAVVKGEIAAVGIILVAKQIPHVLGYDKDPEGDQSFLQNDGQNTFSEITNVFSNISLGAIIIGLVSFTLLIIWQTNFFKKNKVLSLIPGPLVVVIVSIFINYLYNIYGSDLAIKSEHLVNLSLPENPKPMYILLGIKTPDFSVLKDYNVFIFGLMISAVASIETLLNIEALDKIDPNSNITPTNRELIAQGVGNFFCGLIGGIPMTSAIVRSAANVNAGGKTKISVILHAILFIVLVLFFPFVLELIPLSALAAILMFTGFRLTRPYIYKNVYKLGFDQFLPFIATIIVMLLTDLLKGITVGIFISIIFILRNNFKTPFKLISEVIDGKPNYFMKLSQNVTFINKGRILNVLHGLPKGSKIYIDGGRVVFIDKDILELISEFKYGAQKHEIEVVIEELELVDILAAHSDPINNNNK